MIPLPQAKVPGLTKIIQAMIEEANLTQRTTVEHCLAKLIYGYTTRGMDAYVDDVDNPQRTIVFGRFPGIVTDEDLGVILFIYAPPELRNAETRDMFQKMIDAYQSAHSRSAILASDWVYNGANMGTGAFLRTMGFSRQEVVYVKMKK